MFHRHGYTAVPVLYAKDKYVGSVSEGDFLRCVLLTGTTEMKKYERHKISEIVRHDFCPPLCIDANSHELLSAIMNQNFVPVTDSRGILCGIVTRRGVIQMMSDDFLSNEK